MDRTPPPSPSLSSEKRSIQKLLVMVCFAMIGLLSGSFFMTFAVKQLRVATASRSWPRAQAQVTRSVPEYHASGKSKGYSQRFAYHYQVDNVLHRGSTIDFNERLTKTPDESLARVDHHTQGDVIWIHYDPARPARSVYRPGPQRGTYLLILLASFPLLVGTGLLALVVRQTCSRRVAAPFP